MKKFITLLVVWLLAAAYGIAQPVGSGTNGLDDLITEALRNNPEIRAAVYRMDAAGARVLQESALDDPELTYMRDEMPGFRWKDAMYSRLELSQRIRFPSKLVRQSELAEIQVEHAHHDHMEKANEVLAALKSAYYELWFVQQSIRLTEQNSRLLKQFTEIAQTKYGVGLVPQQDVLKAYVEGAKNDNQLVSLRQRELGTKAMIMAILNRPSTDTLGSAILADRIDFIPALEQVEQLALMNRPMLLHDSLAVEESRLRLSLARSEYLPDFSFALQYVTSPIGDFSGWGIKAAISLPFAPWTLAKTNARSEEAAISIRTSAVMYNASRNAVLADARDLYFKIQSAKRQAESYRTVVLPQARQSLQASMIAYQNGKTDFLMLIDAYRTLVELEMESLMVRTEFEKNVAELERAVGVPDIAGLKEERN